MGNESANVVAVRHMVVRRIQNAGWKEASWFLEAGYNMSIPIGKLNFPVNKRGYAHVKVTLTWEPEPEVGVQGRKLELGGTKP